MNKSYIGWLQTRHWCMTNPRKKAAVVTSNGTFEVVFIPRDKPTIVFDEIGDVPHDWIRDQLRGRDGKP